MLLVAVPYPVHSIMARRPPPLGRRSFQSVLIGALIVGIAGLALAWQLARGEYGTALLVPAGVLVLYSLLRKPHVFAAGAGILYVTSQTWAPDLVVFSVVNVGVKSHQLFGTLVSVALAARTAPEVLKRGIPEAARCLVLPMAAFVLSTCIAAAYGPDPQLSLNALFHVLGGLSAFAFAIVFCRDESTGKVLRLGVTIAGIIAATTAIFDALSRRAMAGFGGGAVRARGILGRANVTADVSLISLAAFVRDATARRSSTGRVLSIAGILVCVVGIFATFTRAPMLGAVLFAMVFFSPFARSAKQRLGRWQKLLLVGAAVGAVVLGVASVDEKAVQQRVEDVPIVGRASVADPMAGSGRVRIWTAVVREMARSDWSEWAFGHGLYATLAATRGRMLEGWVAHNSYLEVLFNQGLAGLLAYGWFLWILLRQLLLLGQRGSPDARIAGIMVLAIALSTDMFTSAVYSYAARWYMFTLAGAALGAASSREA